MNTRAGFIRVSMAWVFGLGVVLSASGLAWSQDAAKKDEEKPVVRESKPGDTTKPPETQKPADTPKPTEQPKPAEPPKTEAPKAPAAEEPVKATRPPEPPKAPEVKTEGAGAKPTGDVVKPPAQEDAAKGGIQVNNIRFVTSELGAVMASPAFQPGERITVRYDILNAPSDSEGKSDLTVTHVLRSAADGKVVGKKEVKMKTICAQGPPIIYSARGVLPPGTAPGKYCFEIAVEAPTGQKGTAKADFEIGEPKFAAVNVRFTADREGKDDLPPVFGLGQRAYLQFTIVGLKVAGGYVRYTATAEAQGPDGTSRKIFEVAVPPISAVGGCAPAIPVTVLLNNSHAGKTTVNVEVNDVGGDATINFPVAFDVLKCN